MAFAGIRISRFGRDVRKCADYEYIFNSDFPSLQTLYDNTVTLAGSASTTLTHNLGFVPFTLAWNIVGSVTKGRSFANSGIFTNYYADVSFDKTNIYLKNNSSSSIQVNVKCYNIDLTVDADYTFPQLPQSTIAYDSSYGIKVSKYGKRIDSKDLRDFILHSRAQSPAALSVVTEQQAFISQPFGTYYLYGTVYVNPINYVPLTYCFFSDDGLKYYPAAPGSQQSGNIFNLTDNVATYLTQLPDAAGITGYGAVARIINFDPALYNLKSTMVVLRDPLVVPQTVQVSY